jgi:hypothetical protein
LKAKTPLRRSSPKAGRPPPRKRPKDTGPSAAVRKLVLERDGWRCFCCGRSVLSREYSLQHRQARKIGGTSRPEINSPANLVVLLGSATTECHGRVESRREEAARLGYSLRSWQKPETTPVFHHRLGWVLLDDDGGMTPYRRAA